MAGEEAEWPEHWRWYRNDDGPYLAHLAADDHITLTQLRTMLAFHGLDLCTEAERKVLELAPDVANNFGRPRSADREIAFMRAVCDMLKEEPRG